MEDAPNIELGGSGRLIYDKSRKTIVSERPSLESELQRRTTERDYHKRMTDKLAENINMLRDALEDIRLMHDIDKIHIEAIAALSRS